MHRAILTGRFDSVTVKNADWGEAYLQVIFTNMNLKGVKNLHAAKFMGPCTVDFATLSASEPLPESFYRACGFPDKLVTYLPSLLENPIQMYSCFISHSARDEDFVKRLHADLQQEGVTCFYAPKDLTIGAKIRDTIDQAIRLHDKLLLVLSRNSIHSTWVEHEVEAAIERERHSGGEVLFPIMIDRTVMRSEKAWAGNLRRQRNIGDFVAWKNHDEYREALAKLLRDLRKSE
jgi:hypothetical protein